MYYPRWVYNINEDVTRNNMRQYDKMRDEWYRKALELYPNYFKLSGKEHAEARKVIDEKVGFTL